MRKYFFCFLFCNIILSFNASAQNITTIAGVGASGYSGDSGPATSAHLVECTDIAFDIAGNMYITELATVRKVSPVGIITTIAGIYGSPGFSGDHGPASLAQLQLAYGIATDPAGNIYIADGNNNHLRKIDAAGTITTIAGIGVSGYTGDGIPATDAAVVPADVQLDNAGNIYIADAFNNRIRKIDPSGIITTLAGNGAAGYSGDGIAATATSLNYPWAVALDGAGNMYIADRYNNRIRKVNASGIISTVAGNGTSGTSGDNGLATAAELAQPIGVAVDDGGNIYVSLRDDPRIRRINAAGIITTIAGNGTLGYSGDGGRAKYAQLGTGGGKVLVHGAGRLYIADFGNASIRLVQDGQCFFTSGHLQHLPACGITSLDTVLTVNDPDTSQRLIWSLLSSPMHGTATVAYTDTATGSPVVPVGLHYTPITGYSGPDTFKVRISDEILADTVMVCVTATPDHPGTTIGPDSVCVGYTIALTNPVAGGMWSASNINATVSTTGIVTGVSTGSVMISYTMPCNGVGTSKMVAVKPANSSCSTGIREETSAEGGIKVYPSPNSGTFTISSLSTATVKVTGLMGEKIKEFSLPANVPITVQLDAPTGVYFLSATIGNDIWYGKMVIVR